MLVQTRPLTDDDLPAAWELGRLAFGSAPEPPPYALRAVPGMVRYGAFDAAGNLVGKAVDLHHEQWWAGRRVTAADVAGVAVSPEARGRGVASALLRTLLANAHERGAAVSALFPTVAAPYRASGWAVTGALLTADLPTSALPLARPSTRLTVRRGGPADLAAAAELYERVARHRCGMLTRRGELFDAESATAGSLADVGLDGLTLVERDGRLVGYAGWERGRSYDDTSVLTVHDLFAVDAEAARELVAVLASWRSVAPTLRLHPLVDDALAAIMPVELLRERRRQVWMHRPVDVTRAVADRGWPAHQRGTVEFGLDDPVAPWNAGTWRLEVADGEARLRRITSEPQWRLTVAGFALLYAGAATGRAVAEAGLLTGPATDDPAALDLLHPGQPARLLDYF